MQCQLGLWIDSEAKMDTSRTLRWNLSGLWKVRAYGRDGIGNPSLRLDPTVAHCNIDEVIGDDDGNDDGNGNGSDNSNGNDNDNSVIQD
ncbi:hypothetical protein TWF481_009048 [Arthrobotrys musiformis]|uniref:Uncharacterized protein n=1 Tax=Arthrobotrys musiformis TaxID=47236 RepID=A0AAV9W3W3_9PEZI